ncbi:hypothetical protein GGI20_003620 [Coemansia sp. BCRC 34301]|nr:hypothetical protein GGI20_003620 [Coemansia sp. BCRC 34301]
MSVYNNGRGGLAESVVGSEFDGPHPSRYVPKVPPSDGENRIAATPSLYSSTENIARSAENMVRSSENMVRSSENMGRGPYAAGPQPYQNSGYANVSGPAPLAAARPSPNASFASAGNGGMGQEATLAAYPSAMPQQQAPPPISSNAIMGTMPYTGPVHPPHGHHYAPSNGGSSADGASAYGAAQRAPTAPQLQPGTAYYPPSSAMPTSQPGGAHAYATYSGAPPPARAQTSFSASSYAPPSTYGGAMAPPPSTYGGAMAPPPSAYGGAMPPPGPLPQPGYGGGGGGSGPSMYSGGGGGGRPQRDGSPPSSRVNTAGKIALGALAAGAVAYGVHELVEQHEEDEERRRLAIAAARRQQEDAERQRRENEARRRREEEEDRRREDHERWRRDEDERHRQDAIYGAQSRPASAMHAVPASVYGGRPRADSISSHHSRASDPDVFRPPAPFGRPPYSFMQDDVRFVDPSRSSHASATPETYPELRQSPSDPVIKIGTVLALKHLATGRLLRSDRSHSTASGSNHQLVYASRRNPADDDWWQVLPANQEVPVPGSIVSYGTQIRLRHINSGRHLHSHYGFIEGRSGHNEATAYGDQTLSDENDHWVVERWGDGGYTQTWNSSEVIVLRHYVSGMALNSHKIMLKDDVQSVTCHGPGSDENAKWKVVLSD